MDINKIYLGNCLELMPEIETGSIDMILCDLPYGTTACKWDTIIPFHPLWEQYKRIIKPNGAIVLFGSEPFSSALRTSNIKDYRYDWIWEKNNFTGFLSAEKRPLKAHETISIFYINTPIYNPQKYEIREEFIDKRKVLNNTPIKDGYLGKVNRIRKPDNGYRYPTSILKFVNKPNNSSHPTQKPVSLMEYLIKTYTNEGELVLDNCIGSGTTAIACLNTKRNFIGMEQEQKYFEIANKRIVDLQSQTVLF